MLGRLGFQLTRRGDPGNQGQMDEENALAAELVAELADRLEEREALYVADRAADFAKDKILVGEIGLDELLDRVGDVGDDLNRRAQIFAAPFAADHRGVDPPGGDRIAAPCGDPDIALIVAEIEIGLGTVVGDEHLAVLVRAHRAGVDVQVGIELAQPDLEAACLQQRAECCRRQTLAKRGNHAAGDEDEPRHGFSVYSIRRPHPKCKCRIGGLANPAIARLARSGGTSRESRAQRASGTLGWVGSTGGVGSGGGAGEVGTAGVFCSMIDRGARSRLCMTTSNTLVIMNAAARIAVARVRRLAVERPVMKPDMPPPPMPSAPPSLFCSRMTPTRAIAIRTCTANSTMIMVNSQSLYTGGSEPPERVQTQLRAMVQKFSASRLA